MVWRKVMARSWVTFKLPPEMCSGGRWATTQDVRIYLCLIYVIKVVWNDDPDGAATRKCAGCTSPLELELHPWFAIPVNLAFGVNQPQVASMDIVFNINHRKIKYFGRFLFYEWFWKRGLWPLLYIHALRLSFLFLLFWALVSYWENFDSRPIFCVSVTRKNIECI